MIVVRILTAKLPLSDTNRNVEKCLEVNQSPGFPTENNYSTSEFNTVVDFQLLIIGASSILKERQIYLYLTSYD